MISIVIPTLANRNSIAQTIDSVFKQKTEYIFEIIVVVNGQKFTDSILSKLKTDNRIRLLEVDKPNANSARHLGVINATYNLIAFLDDDDYWKENKLESQTNKIIQAKANFSYAKRQIIAPYKKYCAFKLPIFPENLNRSIFNHNFIGGFSSVMITKEIYFKAGGVDDELNCFQDYDFYLRAMKYAKIVALEDPLVEYHQHFGKKISNNVEYNLEATKRILLKNKDALYKEELKRSLKKMLFRKGIKYLQPKLISQTFFPNF